MPKFHSIKSSVHQFNWELHTQFQENSNIWNKKSADWPSSSEEPVNSVLTFLCAVLQNQCPASCNHCNYIYHQQCGKFWKKCYSVPTSKLVQNSLQWQTAEMQTFLEFVLVTMKCYLSGIVNRHVRSMGKWNSSQGYPHFPLNTRITLKWACFLLSLSFPCLRNNCGNHLFRRTGHYIDAPTARR